MYDFQPSTFFPALCPHGHRHCILLRIGQLSYVLIQVIKVFGKGAGEDGLQLILLLVRFVGTKHTVYSRFIHEYFNLVVDNYLIDTAALNSPKLAFFQNVLSSCKHMVVLPNLLGQP